MRRSKQVVCLCAAENPGPVTVQVCATHGNGDCCGMWTGNIQVIYCPATNDTEDFYVYKLIHSVICDSAYCAVNRSDVLPSTELLTTGIICAIVIIVVIIIIVVVVVVVVSVIVIVSIIYRMFRESE